MGQRPIHPDTVDADEHDPGRFLSPFAVDRDIFHQSVRTASSRRRWRQAVLAVTRRALADGGYHAFSVKALAEETNSTPQTLYNNFGTRDEILAHSIVEYKQWWLEIPQVTKDNLSIYNKFVVSRYLLSMHYPKFSKTMLECVQQNESVRIPLETKFMRSVMPYAQRFVGDSEERSAVLLTKLLKEVTRVTGFDWITGKCSTEDMLADALEGGEWCLAGATSRYSRSRHSHLLEEFTDRHMTQR